MRSGSTFTSMETEKLELNTVRSITLPKGGTMEVRMSEQLLDRVRRQFDISANVPVDDDHIRMFVHGAVLSAVLKAEKENTHE